MSSVLALPLLFLTACSTPEGENWALVRERGAMRVYNRAVVGSPMKEVLAVGRIAAPPWVCKNVVDDMNSFSEFMPYTSESRVIGVEQGAQVVYQLLDAPLISNRDYVMATRDRSRVLPDGQVVYEKTWTAITGHGPAPKAGVVRILKNDGFWRFEGLEDGAASCVTYHVHTDPGGRLPGFIVNRANTRAIPRLFRAVEGRAKDERYWTTGPGLAERSAEPVMSAPAVEASHPTLEPEP